MEHNPWTTLQREEQYRNNWIQVEEHQVLNPAGNPGIYGVVRFAAYAIGIIPVDTFGNTWLVGQYRYPLEAYSWEIPEGGGNKNDTPERSALRELQEETGVMAGRLELLAHLHTSNSVTDEEAFIYLATDLTEGQSSPEETESLQIRKLPLTEAIQMAMDGRITDAMSVAGLLKAKLVLGL
ncbi:MAG TPA: DNA mismatch repair protein MutT [Bacteroidetes bacterium]|nr:DNA mismatch repair protein MutT [Bacteroidota bacterium]HQU40385.1 NUDIX hydrolase [Chitinophagales bacterium]HQU76395.1 NUDIX hydrolase [Chitinophagales bacterium]